MRPDKNIRILIDRNALLQIRREDLRKFPVYIEIYTGNLVLTGSDGESEVEILISIDSRSSTIFERTHDSDGADWIPVFESHFGGICSGVSVFIDGTENKRVLSSEIFSEIYGRNLVDTAWIHFWDGKFLEERTILQYLKPYYGIIRNISDLKWVFGKRIGSSILERCGNRDIGKLGVRTYAYLIAHFA